MSKKFIITRIRELNRIQNHDITQEVLVHGGDDMQVSDGYHTMDELYDHRITLYIALCRVIAHSEREASLNPVWRSKKHSDGEICFGTGTQFVLGIYQDNGQQVTYHIPIERWEETDFANILEKAPEYDGHTPADVLKRLAIL